MSTIKIEYPASSSVALTCGVASLASDTNLLAGRESSAVDNTSNEDVDHLLSGVITTGTSPAAGSRIEVWAYASRLTAAGTPTYPDVLDGTDSAETLTSANVKAAMLRPVATILVDSTSNRAYDFAPVSIASLFGGVLPKFWGIFVVHNNTVALNSTAGNHSFNYERIQAQTV